MNKVVIDYWQFTQNNDNQAGWYCWAYVGDNEEFEKWMHQYCPTASVTFRFNSGNPMYTVFIPDKNEALLFKMQWV